jgi:hypothetical protein
MNRNRATENAANVLLAVEKNKNISLRQIGRNFEIHHTTAQKNLKNQRLHFHSFKYARHQEIFEEDKAKRMEFCEVMMENTNNDRTFMSQILFSDECTFSLHGEPNKQNYRYWSTENQHLVLQTHSQYRNSVNVWVGILGHRIIKPFFIPHRLSGADYLNLLQEFVGPALYEIRENHEIWFQHDGCPAHYTREVKNFLDNAFPNRWIGRGGEIYWSPRSPDLASNGFFLWGHVHDHLYVGGKTYNSVDDLKATITEECQRISCYQLAGIRRNFYARLGYCSAVVGDLFEHLIEILLLLKFKH